MTFETNPTGGRATIRFGDELLEEVDAVAEEHGVDRSEFVRTAVREHLSRHEGLGATVEDYATPDDPELAEAYVELRELCGNRRVSQKMAVNRLYSNDTPKDAVVDEVLRPLRRRGWIEVTPTLHDVLIRVRKPDGGESS